MERRTVANKGQMASFLNAPAKPGIPGFRFFNELSTSGDTFERPKRNNSKKLTSSQEHILFEKSDPSKKYYFFNPFGIFIV